MSSVTILRGDCIAIMRTMASDSIDAIVCDPPYGLGFMGKKWDDLPPGLDWAKECLRVLRPGGHLLAFGGTRTSHRLAVAIEDAGLEIRDSIAWLYGSGFPKGTRVNRDARYCQCGANARTNSHTSPEPLPDDRTRTAVDARAMVDVEQNARSDSHISGFPLYTVCGKPNADGWNVALKPAHEPIIVARKPLVGTVAANVLLHGTGGLNIDATRIPSDEDNSRKPALVRDTSAPFGKGMELGGNGHVGGRWPANVALDEATAAELDSQSGVTTSPGKTTRGGNRTGNSGLSSLNRQNDVACPSDTGGASRFFYVAKAGKKERPVVDGVAHPTVKPLALMRWLVRLVTPPNGIVLDPFAGSGTTLEAARLEGFSVIGIEREAEYIPLIYSRLGIAAPVAARCRICRTKINRCVVCAPSLFDAV